MFGLQRKETTFNKIVFALTIHVVDPVIVFQDRILPANFQSLLEIRDNVIFFLFFESLFIFPWIFKKFARDILWSVGKHYLFSMEAVRCVSHC